MTIHLSKADHELARKIHDIIVAAPFHGDQIAQELVSAARKANLPISLACGLVEHESGFKNVYGHDAVRNPIKSPPNGLLRVTEKNYASYLVNRKRGYGNQGVGPAQLTAAEFQDKADYLGGCWRPFPNMLVAFQALQGLIAAYARRDGLAAYNGGPGGRHTGVAQAYARAVLNLETHWHKKLA